jgi:Uncharacterized alpha/beta hydrolase domain (DUF2235)
MTMPKNLVVCCDGTWNDPDELRERVARPTNVAKLALALDSDVERPASEQVQLVHYVPGVGTAAGEHLIGGAFGVGISANIRDGYRFLAHYYCPGDRVFLFGFSRGAYTARSLGGLIHNCGILREECVDQVESAYAFYRDRTNQSHPRTVAARIFRDAYSHADSSVYFIGVWDTVGALGIPKGLPGWDELSKVFTGWEELWGFHDTQLSPGVRFAYQALAIDEERPPYEPTLWTVDGELPTGQVLEQVWFAGVHSEVGGGTDDSALSDIAFLWMAEQATAAGAVLRDGWLGSGVPDLEVPAPAPNYAGPLRQSRHGVWDRIHPLHRLTSPEIRRAANQSVSSSARRRHEEGTDHYDPPGLEWYLGERPIVPTVES